MLDPTTTALYDGAGASIAISVGSVSNALSVPISALHQLGALDTVDVLANGKPAVQRVSVGAVSVDRAQITAGLTAGQRVVLAEVSAPIPTNSSLTGGRRFGGAGGLGGGAAVLGTTGRAGGR